MAKAIALVPRCRRSPKTQKSWAMVTARRRWMPARMRFTTPGFDGKLLPLNAEGSNMRYLLVAIVMAAGAGLIGTTAASAAPANGQAIAQAADHVSYVNDVAGGCGRGWHRDRFGRCVP
jgi:hypothetical protein